MNQRQGVYAAVVAVHGEPEGKVELTDKQTDEVVGLIVNGIMDGSIEYKGDGTAVTREKINKYVPGLLNNWLRKDPNLNGGVKYETKNKGSRAGSGDEPLKAMKALLQSTDDPEAKAEINRAIENRKAELNAAKAKPVNVAALPPELLKFVPAK